MTELLKAATEMFQAFTALAKYALDQERAKTGNAEPARETEAPKKERKARAPKEEIAAAPAPAPAAQSVGASVPSPTPPAVDLSEDESLKEVRALAKTYVQRFANQVDGIKAFRELIAATTGVARIDDLVHVQRLKVIAKAKEEIAKKDVVAKVPETAGTAV